MTSSLLDVVVAEVDGFRPLTVDLFRPASAPVPLVVWIHGGAWRRGSNKRDAPPLAPARIGERIVAAGFALARVTYRLSGEAVFPAQLDDVRAAIRWLRRRAGELGLDPERFAVWGESAGGHLAALAALTGEGATAVQAAVIWYAPSNLLTMPGDTAGSPESLLIGGPVRRHLREAAAASPVTYVSAGAPPMLLVHGEQDEVVPAAQSRELYDRLSAAGANPLLRLIPGAGHCFTGADAGSLADEGLAFLDFLRRP